MKRHWNSFLWMGFIFILIGLLSYIPIFARFPITRDVPWVNLLLFLIGGVLLGMGLMRAYKQPDLYRGKIFGPILSIVGVLGVSLFIYGLLIQGRQMPASAAAPKVGQKAPDFALSDQNGKMVSLADLVSSSPPGTSSPRANGVLLIFYRGYW